MNLQFTRRHMMRLAAFSAIPISGAIWYKASKSSLQSAIRKTVQIAFGPDILSQDDLKAFARDIAPVVPLLVDEAAIRSATDWCARMERQNRLFQDPDLLKAARLEAEEQHRVFTNFIATRFVESTDFAYDPNADRVYYSGLLTEWPASKVIVCAPLAAYGDDDGWPV
ncbi:hypothetical protein [Yoonia sp. BS5-3]|uniref:Gluconate 2-dehydrogenase subunit 3 family protein n=1 Tax=Yoonia phaeophyticola TaxID=3137369 RepID=A0ABZ2V8Z1_9RHOB